MITAVGNRLSLWARVDTRVCEGRSHKETQPRLRHQGLGVDILSKERKCLLKDWRGGFQKLGNVTDAIRERKGKKAGSDQEARIQLTGLRERETTGGFTRKIIQVYRNLITRNKRKTSRTQGHRRGKQHNEGAKPSSRARREEMRTQETGQLRKPRRAQSQAGTLQSRADSEAAKCLQSPQGGLLT